MTLLAAACLLLPLIENSIASILFLVARPLLIVLVVFGVALAISLLNLILGMLAGLHPRSVTAGPLQLYRGPGGWTAGINRSWRSFVGSVLMTPGHGRFSRTQGVLLAGVGLLASLVLMVYAFVEARARGWPGIDDPAMSEQVEALLLAIPLGTAIVFLAELLTGGTVLWSMFGSTDQGQARLLTNMTLAAHMAAGRRPSDWETDLVEQATSVPDSSADHLIGLGFAYLHAVDSGDLAGAGRSLNSFEQWLQESSSTVRPYVLSSLAGYVSLYHERAWLSAAYHRDLETASEYLNRAADYRVVSPVDLRVKAEILALEGDTDAARRMAEAARAELDQLPPGERWRIPFERDLLARLPAVEAPSSA